MTRASDDGAPRHEPTCRIGGRYDVIDVLGAGGMGVVYRARCETGRYVALKLMRPEFASEPTIRERLLREAEAVGRISHPHVVALLDTGEDDALGPYAVFEMLEGHSLADRLDFHRRLPHRDALTILEAVLSALDAAHDVGVVHRDLKPENIHLPGAKSSPVVQHEGLKVLDFGISRLVEEFEDSMSVKLTRTGTVIGTPIYMAPEQALGEAQDQRADIYAAGVVLYEMLTGALPHEGENYNQLMARALSQPPIPIRDRDPAIDEDLAGIVHRALAREPADRFPSAASMRDAVQAYRVARFDRSSSRPAAVIEKPVQPERVAVITPLAYVTAVPPPPVRGRRPNVLRLASAALVACGVLCAAFVPRAPATPVLRQGAMVRATHLRAAVAVPAAEPAVLPQLLVAPPAPTRTSSVGTRSRLANAIEHRRLRLATAPPRLIVANPYRSP